MVAKQGVHPCDWAVASFAEAMEQEPAVVEFPDWNNPATGEPFRCYVFPVSVKEQDAITRARVAGGMEPVLETVMQRAKDRDGNRIFQAGHRARLRNESGSNALSDLCIQITGAVPPPASDLASAVKP